jgi:predicted kinase
VLIAFGGLPGVGKTTIARELARQLGAVHLRIDSIEHAIRKSGVTAVSLDDAGYCAAYAVAEDNLRLGLTVIADSVNPLPITRNAWRAVAERSRVKLVEIEVRCSDPAEHRRRVETRPTGFPGWHLAWQEVVDRDYQPWDRDCVIIDTAHTAPDENVNMIREIVLIRKG